MLAYLRRGEAYLQRADLELAARDLGTAAALDPSAPRPLEDLGDVQYRRQRFAQAVQNYETRLKLDERSAPVTYKLALARYRTGNLDGALAAVAQTLKLDAEMADAYYLRGMCLRERRDTAGAVDAFEHAVDLAPASIPPREELADAYGALNRRAEEIEQLQALAALDREHPERQVALGLAQARSGHWDLAVLTLSGAIEKSPGEPLLYRALAETWLNRPREKNDRVYLSKAREALERVSALPTASSTMLLLYGRALLQENDVDIAEQTLLDATRRFPVDPQALAEYAALAERQGHLDSARTALVAFDQLSNGDHDAAPRAAHIAALSARLNDQPGTVTWLQRVTALTPDDARAFAALADAELRSGDKAGASAAVARGLAKDPSNQTLQALSKRLP
jgi:tetratricopeptide (TPR) repeat protein